MHLDELIQKRPKYDGLDQQVNDILAQCRNRLGDLLKEVENFNEELAEKKTEGKKVHRSTFIPFRQIDRLRRISKKVKAIRLSLKKYL